MAVTNANQERFERLSTRLQTPDYTGFLSTTLPLFANKGDHLALFGSGVLFQLADHHFLITAAHVMDEALKAERHGYSFFVDGRPGHGLLPLNKFLVLRSLEGPLGRDDDPFDLAVARLPKELAEALVPHRRFLHMPEIDAFDPQHRESGYAIYGYPSAGLTMDPDIEKRGYEPMLYVTTLCQRDVGALHPPHDPRWGYLLNFSQQYCVRLDGGSGGPKNPKGISGCGIWRIIADAAATDRWKPDDVRLVGIEHGWKPEKHYVRGTRIGYAIAMILKKYPELRPVVEISRPFNLVL
jgi:hypothetical protein